MRYGRFVLMYVVLLIVLVSVHHQQRKRYARILHDFERIVDKRRYLYTKQLFLHRKTIYEYEDNVDALFATKKKLMNSDQKSYITFFDDILSDLVYAEKLLDEKLVKDDDERHAKRLYASLLSMRQNYHVLTMLLLVCTLGLYSIWRQPLLD